MTKRLILGAIFAATAVLCALPDVAFAQSFGEGWERPDASNWPLEVIERPLTLSQNMLELSGDTVRLDMSNDQFGEPISVAPDLFYGVTGRLTLGIVHDVGVCVVGGCGYNDGGVAALVRIYEGDRVSLAAIGRVHGTLSIFGATVGAKLRVRTGQMAIVVAPGLYVGIRGRLPPVDAPPEDIDKYRSGGFEVPVQVQLQIGDRTMAYVTTGLTEGTFDEFGRTTKVPFGFGASLTLSSRLDLGGEFYIHNFVGPSPGKNQERTLSLRLAIRI